MNSDNMTKEMFGLARSSADAAWAAMNTLQNHGERMANLILDQSSTLQSETRRYLNEWVANAKRSQEDLRKSCVEGLNTMASMLAVKPEPKSK